MTYAFACQVISPPPPHLTKYSISTEFRSTETKVITSATQIKEKYYNKLMRQTTLRALKRERLRRGWFYCCSRWAHGVA